MDQTAPLESRQSNVRFRHVDCSKPLVSSRPIAVDFEGHAVIVVGRSHLGGSRKRTPCRRGAFGYCERDLRAHLEQASTMPGSGVVAERKGLFQFTARRGSVAGLGGEAA
jgi:hypothetical protein